MGLIIQKASFLLLLFLLSVPNICASTLMQIQNPTDAEFNLLLKVNLTIADQNTNMGLAANLKPRSCFTLYDNFVENHPAINYFPALGNLDSSLFFNGISFDLFGTASATDHVVSYPNHPVGSFLQIFQNEQSQYYLMEMCRIIPKQNWQSIYIGWMDYRNPQIKLKPMVQNRFLQNPYP